VCCLSWC